MSYATSDDVFKRYPPILTMVGSDTSVQVSTDDVSSVYINDAESYVNAYLARKYQIPLQPEPIITQVTADIAIYRLAEDRTPVIPDICEKRWINANSVLMMLLNGDMILTASGQVQVLSGDNFAWSSAQSLAPIFRAAEEMNCRSLMVDPFFELDRP